MSVRISTSFIQNVMAMLLNKQAAANTLKKFGIYINESTDAHLLTQFLKKLKPVESGKGLIRIGGDKDGGYLIPNDLEGITHCFSPGVGPVANFEHECFQIGIKSFLADYSVNKPPIDLAGCDFIKKYVRAYSSPQTITMEDWVTSSLPQNHVNDLLLQMDIEGAEYETLLSTPMSILKRFRIIAIEFHNFQKLDNKEYFKLVAATIEKILELFTPVHLHINNSSPSYLVNGVQISPEVEVTFLRKDRIEQNQEKIPSKLPHPLDRDCAPDRKTTAIPKYWA